MKAKTRNASSTLAAVSQPVAVRRKLPSTHVSWQQTHTASASDGGTPPSTTDTTGTVATTRPCSMADCDAGMG